MLKSLGPNPIGPTSALEVIEIREKCQEIINLLEKHDTSGVMPHVKLTDADAIQLVELHRKLYKNIIPAETFVREEVNTESYQECLKRDKLNQNKEV